MGLRKSLFAAAEQNHAFAPSNGGVKYDPLPPSSSSDLTLDLFFETKTKALDMESSIGREVRRFGVDPENLVLIVPEEQPMPAKRVYERDYSPTETPERVQSEGVESLPESDAFHSQLTRDDIAFESWFTLADWTAIASRPHWAHLLEKEMCKGPEAKLMKDPGNRIVLPTQLHDLYDGRTAQNVPLLTIFLADQQPDGEADSSGRSEVSIVIELRYHEMLPFYLPWFRNTQDITVQGGRPRFLATLRKLNVGVFKEELTRRHGRTMLIWN